jgi:signal transduction histidine kinase
MKEPGEQMKREYGIRSSMIFTVSVLTLLPLTVAMIISLVMFHRETTGRINMENLRTAYTIATAVELFATRPVVMLKQIRDEVDEDCGPDLSKITPVANATLDTDPLFESVMFVNGSGELVGVAGENVTPVTQGTRKQNFSDSVLFKRLRRSGNTVWSEPFVSLKSGESVIAVAIPWHDGMISGTMNLSYFIKLVEPTKTALNAYAFIVSPEGRLIAHPDKSLVGDKEAFISIPQITAGLQGTEGTYNFKLSGRSVVGSVLPFAKNEWVIVAVHDKEKAYASLYRMEKLLGYLTVLVLAGALFYSFRRVERITAPIIALSEFTHCIASNERTDKPFETAPFAEIRELYQNFQTMAVAVAQRESDLQERNEELTITEEELRSQVEEYLKTYDALAAEKAKLDSILASMGEGLSIQSLEYEVLLQNPAHKVLFGDAVGKRCYEVDTHNDSVCSDCPLKLAYEDGATHTVLRTSKRDGWDMYLEVSASPLRNSCGEVTGGIEVVRDVTGRVLADQEIRRLNQELEARVIARTAELEMSNRELESFSYSVSHDLRAPLRHISSFSAILESDHADNLDNEGKYYLSRIMAGCNKMGLLIDDLLELAQLSKGELIPVQVNLSNMASVITASLVESDPERAVSFKIAEGLVVNGDERLIEVLLNNLLGNAWKYSARKKESLIEFGCKTIAASPVFFIKDNGAGFDMSYADKLFAPFQRLHGAEFEGTGIGLAIVQRIVHRHGGKIWADAVVDEGATFYFTLNS